jgi:hypothetical protein
VIRTARGRKMMATKKIILLWDGVNWIVRGEEVLGWMDIRSASSVSQLTVLRKKFPLAEK